MNQPAAGMINGQEWSVKHAYVDPTIETPNEDDYVVVFLPYKPKAECPSGDATASDSRALMAPGPLNTKLTRLKRGSPRNAVFQFNRQGEAVALAAVTGQLQFTQVGSKRVKGKIVANFNSDNWLNGNFTAVVCEVGDLKAPRHVYNEP